MKIKKIFQKLFKNTFYKFFKLIYGKITFDINNKDVKIFEINSKEILTYEKKNIRFIKFLMAVFITIMFKMLQLYQTIK